MHFDAFYLSKIHRNVFKSIQFRIKSCSTSIVLKSFHIFQCVSAAVFASQLSIKSSHNHSHRLAVFQFEAQQKTIRRKIHFPDMETGPPFVIHASMVYFSLPSNHSKKYPLSSPSIKLNIAQCTYSCNI